MIEEEKAEWLQHINAIEFHKSNSHLNNKINDKTIGNSFHLTDTKILNEVNTALSKSNCEHHIKIEDMDFSQADCLKKENDNWKDPIFRSKNLIEFAEEHGEGDGLWINMATDYISEAIGILDKTDSKIINLQKWYTTRRSINQETYLGNSFHWQETHRRHTPKYGTRRKTVSGNAGV